MLSLRMLDGLVLSCRVVDEDREDGEGKSCGSKLVIYSTEAYVTCLTSQKGLRIQRRKSMINYHFEY